jgi:hypothetical protein
MYRWSIKVDISGGIPSSVIANEVEWNSVTEEWDDKSGGHAVTFDAGSVCSWNSDLKWYHADIEHSGHYTAMLNGSSEIEGYVGKKIDTGDRDADIDSNTAHATTVTGNPHSVTKGDLGLGNVENKSSSTIRGEIVIGNIPVSDIDIKDCADSESNLITVNALLDGLVSGYTSANQALEYIAAKLIGSPLFAKMLNEIMGISSGTSSPSGSVTPTRIGQLYVETTSPKLYVSDGLTNTDWFAVN